MSFIRNYARLSIRNFSYLNRNAQCAANSCFLNDVICGHKFICAKHFTLLHGKSILHEPIVSDCALGIGQCRGYAKKKDKGGGKKGGGKKVSLSDEELSEVINYDKMIQQMDEIIELLKQDFIKQLSLRSNMGSFETLLVETDDGKFPLKQIAQIAQKSPTLVAINCGANSQYLANVKAALDKSGMNVNPQIDKNSIFVPLPKVTREHRETLAKSAKTLSDRSKDKLKEVHNKYQRDAKKKSGASSDLVHGVVDMIHDKLHEYQANCEALMKKKQEELLK